jgi:prolyl oligopeptidase
MCTSNLLIVLSFLCSTVLICQEQKDPYLWLEEIEGEKTLEWVKTKNNATVEALQKHPEFKEINKNILDILNSKEQIAYPSIWGEYIYNFWQDDINERGLWRRTTLEEYFKDSPRWETVLDLDDLCKKEGEKWAYKGASFLYPQFDRALLFLSRGGSDAVVIREFDLIKNNFVKDGFYAPEAKGFADWIDENTILIKTDFGKGTMTTSGYPRILKIWNRRTPLKEARTIFQAEESDMGCYVDVINTTERQYVVITRKIDLYKSDFLMMENDSLIKLEIPEDSQFDGFLKNQMLIELKSDWNIEGKIFKQGSLISIDYTKFLNGNSDFQVLFEPEERSSLVSVSITQNFLLINKLTNVRSELFKYSLKDDNWISKKVKTPDYGSIFMIDWNYFTDQYFFIYENFLEPTSLYYVFPDGEKMEKVKSQPDFFNSQNFEVKQFEALSKDGTRIPCFVVCNKNTEFDGSNPTLLYGYGGFEIAEVPYYSAEIGVAWLEKGGVYVLSNIRGGGEFGPKWHQIAIKENRQRAFDDFISVAEDLIIRKITTPKHLGIKGASNGGLLVGVAFTQRPDLYSAVVCSRPLLDMERYNKLLAGPSWVAEYGNPDVPEEWEYIKKYSPYHNILSDKKYPRILFTTTKRDDRVHPGHARKMVAKMVSQGHEVLYFENTEGGHGVAVTNEDWAFVRSLEWIFLLNTLK